MNQLRYDYLKKRLDEIEELKIFYIEKLDNIYQESKKLRDEMVELEKEANQHEEECICMKCENK